MTLTAPDRLIYDLGRPFKAHDVRRLRQCPLCEQIGYEPQMLALAIGEVKAGHYHGSCIVRSMSHDEVLALPSEQAAKLRA